MVEGKTIQLQIWDTVFKWIYSLARTFTVRWLEVFTTGRLLCFWSTQWMIEAVSAIFSTGFRNFRQRVVSMFLCFWWGLRVIWGTRWVLSRLSRQWKVSMVLFTLRLVLSKGRVWMLCSLKLLSRCINCTLFLPNTVRWWTVSVWQWQRVLRCVHLWLYSRWVRVLCLNLLVRVDVADFSIYYCLLIIWNEYAKGGLKVFVVFVEAGVAVVGSDSGAWVEAERGESYVFVACEEGVGFADGGEIEDGSAEWVVFEWDS